MFDRLLRIVAVTSLALLPMQATVERESQVAFAQGGSCLSPAYAAAYVYGGGFVNDSWNQLSGTYGDYSACLQAAQQHAISVAGNACGSYGAGQAYALVNWHISWNGQYQGEVNQQYDCGDV